MLAIKGVCDGKHILPLEDVSQREGRKVIITFLDEEEENFGIGKLTAEQEFELQEALEQADRNELIDHEEIVKRAKSWFTK